MCINYRHAYIFIWPFLLFKQTVVKLTRAFSFIWKHLSLDFFIIKMYVFIIKLYMLIFELHNKVISYDEKKIGYYYFFTLFSRLLFPRNDLHSRKWWLISLSTNVKQTDSKVEIAQRSDVKLWAPSLFFF